MKGIVLFVCVLLAIFIIVRAYAQGDVEKDAKGISAGEARFLLHPGIIEVKGEEGEARLSFGLLDRSESKGRRLWDLFPLRISVRVGKKEMTMSLNGLAFVTRSRVRVGKPIRISGTHRGDVVSVGGPVTVEGRVEGDVWSLGADVSLGPGALVTGNVVALGGTIETGRGSRIRGNKQALPEIKIPFLDLLSSDHAAAAFMLVVEVLGIILYLIALLLFNLFAGRSLGGITASLASHWRGSFLYLVLTLLLVPLLTLLLVATIAGILLIPALFVLLVLLAYLGYLAVTVRLGAWLRGKAKGSGGFFYSSGLLGLLIIKGPLLLGILFNFLAVEFLQGIGRILISVGMVFLAAAYLYGLGGMLQHLRIQARAGG